MLRESGLMGQPGCVGAGTWQFANREAVGRSDGRTRCRVRTPPPKIRIGFQKYKHTSLSVLINKSWAFVYLTQNTVFETNAVTFGRP